MGRLRKATGGPTHRTQNLGHEEIRQRENDQGRSLGKTQEPPGSGRFGSWCVILELRSLFTRHTIVGINLSPTE